MKKNIKKLIFSLALALGLALGAAAVCSFAQTDTVDGITYTYEVVDNRAVITGITGESKPTGNYTIPDDLGGHLVTALGNDDFMNVFQNCTGLESVTIPKTVKIIGKEAFHGCTSLNTITFEEPSQLTKICWGAFMSCNNLENITIPESVTEIGGNVFVYCKLTELEIPKNVETIESPVIGSCSSLENINVDSENNNFYSENGVLYNKEKTTLIKCPEGKTGSLNILDGVEYIGKSAISACVGLTSVTIPESVTTIEESAFSVCTGLTSVMIPESVTTIEESAFSYCNGLQSVTIPSNVASMGECVFSDCFGLTNVYVKDGQSLGVNPFLGDSQDINVWRYSEPVTQGGKMHVTITSVEDKDGNPISAAGSLNCKAMGNDYVIDEIEVEGVQLSHTLTSHAEHAATCTEAGNSAYWSCSECGKYFSDAAGTTEIEADSWVREALGHDWGNPTYVWAQDNSTCTATRVCRNDASHVETEDGTITSEVTTAATCEVAGTTTYTATFANEAFANQTKNVDDIPATGHSWSMWISDGDTNHKRTCGNCGAEEKTAHSWKISVTKEVSDIEDGQMKYLCDACGEERLEVVPALTENTEMLVLEQSVNMDGNQINCKVQDPYKVLPEGVKLEVKLVENGTDRWNELKPQLDNTYTIENLAFFDIKLYDLNDNEVPMPLSRKVRVLLQIPDGWDKEDMEAVLITVDKDIEFEENIVTIDGVNYVAFWTNHFSPYAEIDKLTDEEARNVTPENSNNGKIDENSKTKAGPETGDATTIRIIFEIFLLLASEILFIELLRRKFLCSMRKNK